MSEKKIKKYIVLAVTPPKPGFKPVSIPLPRHQAVLIVRDKWISGSMARLHPPLRYYELDEEEAVQGTA